MSAATISIESLAAAARIEVAGPEDLARRLGLRGPLPEGDRVPVLAPLSPARFTEVWAFRAGLKPVAFLTVDPSEADAVAAQFGPAHVERRTRRVQVGPQDAWVDERARGLEKVELYVAHDASLSLRAARLQAEGDPGRAVEELGALMGYPACCVAAFAAQRDRGNNTWNRYATAARTDSSSWLWELNNLAETVIPFFPCTYRCGAARVWARAVLAEMERTWPGATARARSQLARPALYFEHERQVAFTGAPQGPGRLRYHEVAVAPHVAADFRPFAAAFLAGDALGLDGGALELCRAGTAQWRLERIEPAIGALFPFADEHA